MTTNKVFKMGTVRKIEERFQTEWVSGFGKDAVTKEISIGWFVVMSNGISINFGLNKPDCEPGDDVQVEFRRSKHKGE